MNDHHKFNFRQSNWCWLQKFIYLQSQLPFVPNSFIMIIIIIVIAWLCCQVNSKHANAKCKHNKF